MRRKFLFNLMACAGLSGLVLTGCTSSDSFDPEAVVEKYESTWADTFGDVDANQTWNTASTRTVSVTVAYSGTYTAKVYTADPRSTSETAYLLGEFEVKGDGATTSLQLDVPTALSKVYVSLVDGDGSRFVVAPQISGSAFSASFGGVSTSASTRSVSASTDLVTLAQTDYREYTIEDIEEVLEKLPEGKNNTGNVNQNFAYKNDGTSFTVYPVYFISSNIPNYGIYYTDETTGNIVEVPVWTWEQADVQKWYTEYDGYWSNIYYYDISQYIDSNTSKFQSKGVTITIDESIKTFGFYIKNGGYTYYSQSALNDGDCYGATFHATEAGKTYLAFEDWDYSDPSADKDFNDVVLEIITENKTYISTDTDEETETISWTIACEDLGGTYDYDFNDIVFAVQYAAGNTEATIIPLSAGGVLEADIYYNNTLVGEIHELLGSDDYTVMLNTDSYTAGTSKTLAVGESFSISEDWQNFVIKIYKNGEEYISVKTPGKGEDPQMICVAGKWAWPTPGTNITVAYPGFGEWGANYSVNGDWYESPVSSKVVKW